MNKMVLDDDEEITAIKKLIENDRPDYGDSRNDNDYENFDDNHIVRYTKGPYGIIPQEPKNHGFQRHEDNVYEDSSINLSASLLKGYMSNESSLANAINLNESFANDLVKSRTPGPTPIVENSPNLIIPQPAMKQTVA